MRFALAVLLIAVVVMAVPCGDGRLSFSGPPEAAGPLSLDAYWGQVEQTRQAVVSLQGQTEGSIRAALNGQADIWAVITQVKMPDGALVTLDQSEFVALLRKDPPHLDHILQRLDALLALRGDNFARVSFTQADLDRMKAILARPEFQWAQASSPFQKWWNQFLQKLLDWLGSHFGGLKLGSGGIPLWPLIALLVVGILIFAGRSLLKGWASEAGLKEDDLEAAENLTSEGASQRAATFSGEGNYRTAIRYLYLSALLILDERGLLRYDRSKTNREYLRGVANTPGLVGPLQQVVDVFDRVWYVFESIDQERYQAYLDQVDELRKQKP